MTEKIQQLAQELLPEAKKIRQHLHQHPELSWREKETSAFIRRWLTEQRIELRSTKELYGTVAIIQGKKTEPVIGLRADIDALPIEEKNEISYRSQNSGVMHACGHDGHTTILMTAAKILSHLRNEIPGTIVCVFQPAEEKGGGGEKLLNSGILDGFPIEAFFALHAWPYLPAGTIGFRYGAMMAGIDDFCVTIHGKSGHAAHPYNAVDPVWISAQIINAIQGLVSRESKATDPIVISTTSIHGGTATNIIPASVELKGTIRTLNHATRERIRQRFIEIVGNIAASFGGRAEVEIIASYPPVVNNDAMVNLVASCGKRILGSKQVVEIKEPSMGGEDFGYYLKKYPGAIFRLGVAPSSSLHSDTFNFNDDALETGIKMMTAIGYHCIASSEMQLQKAPID